LSFRNVSAVQLQGPQIAGVCEKSSLTIGQGMSIEAAAGSLKDSIIHSLSGLNTIGAAEQVGTVRSLIKHAAAIGSDVGTVARRSVDGVIEATVEVGGNVAQVAKGAIHGAIAEAGKVSNTAVSNRQRGIERHWGKFGRARGDNPAHARSNPWCYEKGCNRLTLNAVCGGNSGGHQSAPVCHCPQAGASLGHWSAR